MDGMRLGDGRRRCDKTDRSNEEGLGHGANIPRIDSHTQNATIFFRRVWQLDLYVLVGILVEKVTMYFTIILQTPFIADDFHQPHHVRRNEKLSSAHT